MSKWFGEPWPEADLRAPVCEDDADRVDVPVGQACSICGRLIKADDRGVLIPTAWLDRTVTEQPIHVPCLIANVLVPRE